MAFPTSPSNNQVHKETNGKSYVWDSAAGVWDRLADANEFIRSGYLAEDISKQNETIRTKKYEHGHVLQVELSRNDLAAVNSVGSGNTNFTVPSGMPYVNIVPKSDNSLYIYHWRSYGHMNGHPVFALGVSDDNGSSWMHNLGNRRINTQEKLGWSYGDFMCWDPFDAEWTVQIMGFFYSKFKKGQANVRFGISIKNVWHPSGQGTFNISSAHDGSATLMIQEIAQDTEVDSGGVNVRY